MSDIVERKKKEFENRLDTYIYYNEKISDRREVLIDFFTQAIEQTRRETAEEILNLLEEKPGEKGWSRAFNERLSISIVEKYLCNIHLSEKTEEEKHESQKLVGCHCHLLGHERTMFCNCKCPKNCFHCKEKHDET